MPFFDVQITAQVTVSRMHQVEAPDAETASKQALYEVDSLPNVCDWVVPGNAEYTAIRFDRAELDNYGTDEVTEVAGADGKLSDAECEMGLHSWIYEMGKLPPDTKCTRCGDLYGDPD